MNPEHPGVEERQPVHGAGCCVDESGHQVRQVFLPLISCTAKLPEASDSFSEASDKDPDSDMIHDFSLFGNAFTSANLRSTLQFLNHTKLEQYVLMLKDQEDTSGNQYKCSHFSEDLHYSFYSWSTSLQTAPPQP